LVKHITGKSGQIGHDQMADLLPIGFAEREHSLELRPVVSACALTAIYEFSNKGSLYRWKAKYGGMEVSEARRLRQLEEENRQLKHVVAELLLDKRALQAVVTKKW